MTETVCPESEKLIRSSAKHNKFRPTIGEGLGAMLPLLVAEGRAPADDSRAFGGSPLRSDQADGGNGSGDAIKPKQPVTFTV